jgi:hypothetical protein
MVTVTVWPAPTGEGVTVFAIEGPPRPHGLLNAAMTTPTALAKFGGVVPTVPLTSACVR